MRNYKNRYQEESPYYMVENNDEIYGKLTKSLRKLSQVERCYVDPWDLENYDYVRSKIDYSPSPTDYYGSSPIPTNEIYAPSALKFENYTIQHSGYESPCCALDSYADHIYGTKDYLIPIDDHINGYEEFTSTSQESLTDDESEQFHDFSFLPAQMDCCNCYSLYDNPYSIISRNIGNQSIYGGNYGYSNKFGLSKKGLLQIDYSYSWDDLDRTISANY